MDRLKGKVAIITGAAKGLGEADARLFVSEGARVVMTDVDSDAGQKIADEIGAIFVKQDVRSEQGWKDLIAMVKEKHGRLDILVNNAGVVEAGTIETQTYEDYKFINEVSADGTFLGCKYAIALMKESGGGSIINMASIASVQGEPYVVGYCGAKGAVEGMTRSIAVHCAMNKYNIRCNSVHPSGIVTPMVISMGEKMADAGLMSLEEMGAGAGMSKLGEPNDIGYTVLFLASDESKFINGAQIRVDNAMSVVAGAVPE